MFDIANNRGKVQYQGEMLRLMARMEMVFAKGLAPLLRRQFRLAAEAVASGGGDTDRAVDTVAFPLASYFVDRYKRIAAVFGEEALKRWAASELKKQDTMRTRFWQTMNVWARKEAATQVVKVNKTTKNHIARIVHKGMGEGMSNAEMAKEIRKVGQITTNTRARRIARTETHTASVHSINEATKSTGMDFEREWIAALDDRIRRGGKASPWNHVAANGERVGMEEPFKKTGEHLMYPGDPKGSAGNVINCRCVLIYHREKKVVVEKEPKVTEEVLPLEVVGSVSEKHAKQVKRWMNKIPVNVRKKASEFGLRPVTSSLVSDALPHLKGVHPRGWPRGMRWDSANGCYREQTKQVLVTEFVKAYGKITKVDDARKARVLYHEFGHGMDNVLARASQTPGFKALYKKDIAGIKAKKLQGKYRYFLQPGVAGSEEVFAEMFSMNMRKRVGVIIRSDYVEDFSNCYSYVEKLIKEM